MGRNSVSPDTTKLPVVVDDNANPNPTPFAFHSVRDRFHVKRNPNSLPLTKSSSDRSWRRSHHHGGGRSGARKLLLTFPCCGRSVFYVCLFVAVFAFAFASMVMQNSIASMVFRHGSGSTGSTRGREVRENLKFGTSLKFAPVELNGGGGLDRLRQSQSSIVGIRSPQLGLVSNLILTVRFIV